MTWERYAAKETSLEVESYIGPAFHIRGFCDDSTQGIYAAKPPVCKLALDPLTQFVNTDIAWDISASSSATGTVDTFTIDWDGVTDIGDISGASFGVDPETGNVQFTTIGKYTVTAYVVDTLGERSREQLLEIEIVANEYAYIGTTDAGLFLIDINGDNSQSNAGLSGGHLNFRALRLNPWYADKEPAERHLWACTADGLAYSIDGGATWTVISKAALGEPVNNAGDSPAPVTADLDQIDLAFSPRDQDTIYVLRSTATRVWIYETVDYGATWANYQPVPGTAVAIADFVPFDGGTVWNGSTSDGGCFTGTPLLERWEGQPPSGSSTVQISTPTPISWNSISVYVAISNTVAGNPTVNVDVEFWQGEAGPWEEMFDLAEYTTAAGLDCDIPVSTVAGGNKYLGIKITASHPTETFLLTTCYGVIFEGFNTTHSGGGLPGAII
jgi:hypothetical protein